MTEAATQALVAQLNNRLQILIDALNANNAIMKEAIKLATQGSSASHAVMLAVIGTICEMSPDFRTTILRIADSPVDDPVVQGALTELKEQVAQYHKRAGSPVTLKPVK